MSSSNGREDDQDVFNGTFSFGNENFNSRESLKAMLFNYINIGQWELARACLSSLLVDKALTATEVKELTNLITDVLRKPMLYCSGYGGSTCSAMVSWLAFLAIEDLFEHGIQMKLPFWVKDMIDFRLLLYELQKKEETATFEDIDVFYLMGISSLDSSGFSFELTDTVKETLRRLLGLHPKGYSALADALSTAVSNETFQSQMKTLYIDYLKDVLLSMESKPESITRSSLEQLLGALQMFKTHVPMTGVQSSELLLQIAEVFIASAVSSSFGYKDLFGAIVALNDTSGLISQFHIDKMLESFGLCERGSGSDIQVLISAEKQFSLASLSNVIAQCLNQNCPLAWRNLFWICDALKIEFLETLLKSALAYIRNWNLDEAVNLLSPGVCRSLSGLVLLVSWPDCNSYTDAEQLLHVLWKSKGGCQEPVLNQACQKLEYQLKIIRWCIEKARSVLGNSAELSHQTVLKMFHRFDSHSVLYVLNKAHLLRSLPYSEVVELLLEQPIASKIEQFEGSSELRKMKNEIAVYNCYYVIKEFLRMIVLSRIQKKRAAFGELTTSDKSDFTGCLQDLKDIVDKIIPTTMRLELLENLFSLLVLQSSDLFELKGEDLDEDNLEGRTYSVLSSRSGSLESFSTVDTLDPYSKDETLTKNEESARTLESYELKVTTMSPTKDLNSFDSDSCEILENSPVQGVFNVMETSFLGSSFKADYSSSETVKNEVKEVDSLQDVVGDVNNLVFGEDFDANDVGSGFLVSEELMTKALEFLQSCLTRIISEGTAIPSDAAGYSIGDEEFDVRFSRLKQFVSEGVWRLHLLAGSNDGIETYDESEYPESEQEGGNDDNTGRGRVPFGEGSAKRKLLSSSSQSQYNDNIVPKMLAPRESLVYLCLNNNNLVQAQQVIQMFDLGDSESSLETRFIQEVKLVINELKDVSSQAKESSLSAASSPLSSIKSAAAAGRVSTHILSRLDQLLLHPFIKCLNESSVVEDEQGYWKSFYLSQCAILMDLIVSGCLSTPVSKTITDLAEGKCNEAAEWYQINRMESVNPIFAFLLKIKGLLSLGSHLNSIPVNNNVCHFFLSSSYSSDMDSVKMFSDVLSQQESAYKVLQEEALLNLEMSELQKDNSVEGSGIRLAMIELVSSTGLEAVCTPAKLSRGHDYVKCLFKHIDTLATLQLVYKTRHVEGQEKSKRPVSLGVTKAINPFIVLKYEMTVTFGRLLFDWNMSPRRLEGVAKQVNISLFKVIAKHCGVFIPARITYPAVDDIMHLLNITSPVVLNECGTDMDRGGAEHPLAVVKDLLERCIAFAKEIPEEGDCYIGSKKFAEVTESEEFKTFQERTSRLATLDLSTLDVETDKVCFMVNLYNLLMLHGVLMLLSGKLFSSSKIKQVENKKWKFVSLMTKAFGRLNLHRIFTYKVGVLGNISAFDLFQHVLLGGRKTGFFGDGLSSSDQNFVWTDEFLRYAPQYCHPFVIFLLHHCTSGSPQLRSIDSSMISQDIEIGKEFLKGKIHVDIQSSKVMLPELLKLHRHLFLPRQPLFSSEGETALDNDNNWEILKFLRSLSTEIQLNFDRIQRASVSVLYTPYNWDLRLPAKESKLTLPVGHTDFNAASLSTKEIKSLSEPISVYLQEVLPLAGSVVTLSVTHRKLLAETDKLISDQKYIEEFNSDSVSSIIHFVEQGVYRLEEHANKYSKLRSHLQENSSVMRRLLRNLAYFKHHDAVVARLILQLVKFCFQHMCFSYDEEENVHGILNTLLEYILRYGQSRVALNIMGNVIHSLAPETRDLILSEAASDTIQMLQLSSDQSSTEYFHMLEELKGIFLHFSNKTCLSQIVLNHFDILPAGKALEILRLLIEKCSDSDVVKRQMEVKESEIIWCSEVARILRQSSESEASKDPYMFCWQDIKDLVKTQPEEIANILVTRKCFTTLARWSKHFAMSETLERECYQAKLLSVISQSPLDIISAHRVLEQTGSKKLRLIICQNLLGRAVLTMEQSLFLTEYMLNNLTDLLNDKDRTFLSLTKAGTKSLYCLPISMKASYQNLASRPLLLLEQLLMNMKVELAEKVIACIRKEIGGSDDGMLLSVVNAECDELFARYAVKSLEVMAFSAEALVEQASKQSVDESSPVTSSTEHRHSRQASLSLKNNLKDAKTDEKVMDENNSYRMSTGKEKNQWLLPLKPLGRSEWIRDGAVEACMICEVGRYSMFNRRHHCRHCGRVVCSECSKHFCRVPGYTGNVRVCDQCYAQFYSQRKGKPSVKSKGSSVMESNSAKESNVHGSIGGALQLEPEFSLQENETFSEWLLTLDENANQDTRAEFSYEQAPSASLCLSILDLYSNHRACGGLLLKFCNDLSLYIQPRGKSVNKMYEEVDAAVIVGMIRYLLLHAKVKFLKSGDSKGVELCDTYLVHVEVLDVLLAASWKGIPTMQELSQPEALRRLRDKLVEDERFSLAIEVTSKCGLDPCVVWFALGLAQLKAGKLEQARENFAKCMTPTKAETSKVFQQNIPYLEQILEVLETSSPSGEDMDLETMLAHLEHTRQVPGTRMNKRQYDECFFYLSTYGSHGLIVDFLVRHGSLKSACLFIKEKSCDPDVFVEHLLIPCFQEGNFENLSHELKDIDSSLQTWNTVLNSACLHLNRKGLHNCLYEVQLHMKDFFRAAKTCVRFFLGTSGNPPKTYVDLYERLDYLEKARSHIETVLKDRLITRSSFVSHVGSTFLGGDQLQSPQQNEVSNGELKSYLNAIELQVLVTKYFQERPKAADLDQGRLPTLFGHGRERAELVVKLLLTSVEDSFSLASRIVQDFRLPALGVFGRAARKMTQLFQYEKSLALLKIMEDTGMVVEKEKDELLLSIVKSIVQQEGQMKQADAFIRLIRNDVIRIEALISCNRLRDALQKAFKKERVGQVQVILVRAKESNQTHVIDLCERWLDTYRRKEEQQTVLRKANVSSRVDEKTKEERRPSPKLWKERKKK